jgi:hypothetical protein
MLSHYGDKIIQVYEWMEKMTDWEVRKHQVEMYKIFAYCWKGQIVNIECTCMHGSIHKRNWKEGKGICKHIKNYIKNANNKNSLVDIPDIHRIRNMEMDSRDQTIN